MRTISRKFLKALMLMGLLKGSWAWMKAYVSSICMFQKRHTFIPKRSLFLIEMREDIKKHAKIKCIRILLPILLFEEFCCMGEQ